jgi:hypothetical protein
MLRTTAISLSDRSSALSRMISASLGENRIGRRRAELSVAESARLDSTEPRVSPMRLWEGKSGIAFTRLASIRRGDLQALALRR